MERRQIRDYSCAVVGVCLKLMVWRSFQADDLDGEIDLRSCTDVTEYAVQRNYGFQIHVSTLTKRPVILSTKAVIDQALLHYKWDFQARR